MKFKAQFLLSLLRFTLASVFLLAALSKILYFNLFFISLLEFNLFDANFAWLLAWTLIFWELLLSFWLFSGWRLNLSCYLSATTLILFTLVVSIFGKNGEEFDCPCFLGFSSPTTYADWLLRNLILTLIYLIFPKFSKILS